MIPVKRTILLDPESETFHCIYPSRDHNPRKRIPIDRLPKREAEERELREFRSAVSQERNQSMEDWVVLVLHRDHRRSHRHCFHSLAKDLGFDFSANLSVLVIAETIVQ
jgi:hypothetical protein